MRVDKIGWLFRSYLVFEKMGLILHKAFSRIKENNYNSKIICIALIKPTHIKCLSNVYSFLYELGNGKINFKKETFITYLSTCIFDVLYNLNFSIIKIQETMT